MQVNIALSLSQCGWVGWGGAGGVGVTNLMLRFYLSHTAKLDATLQLAGILDVTLQPAHTLDVTLQLPRIPQSFDEILTMLLLVLLDNPDQWPDM